LLKGFIAVSKPGIILLPGFRNSVPGVGIFHIIKYHSARIFRIKFCPCWYLSARKNFIFWKPGSLDFYRWQAMYRFPKDAQAP